MIKRYNVTLNEKVVEEAQQNLQDRGSKLSPVLNNLLKEWNKNMKKIKELKKEEFRKLDEIKEEEIYNG